MITDRQISLFPIFQQLFGFPVRNVTAYRKYARY